jgi:predicted lipoprotein with Yx(FWY)xxD motif
MRLRTRALPLIAAAGLIAAACGNDLPDAADDLPDDASQTEDDADDDQDAAPDGIDLAIADSPLGAHLVDGDGLTLYLFDNDEPGVSNCTDDCLASWPPLTVTSEPTPGDGVDGGLVGTIEREDDGSTQVTYDGMPLYYWAGDAAPGDVNGQGVNDVWWVVAPDGSAITEALDDAMEDDGGGQY